MNEEQKITWLPDVAEPTWAEYECPACGGREKVSSLVDRPLMHRHRYGVKPTQSGVVLLKKIER